MANAVELAVAYMQVVPSMQGGRAALTSELVGSAGAAGDAAGRAAGSKMSTRLLDAAKGVAAPLAAMFAVDKIVEGIGHSITAASDLSESTNKVTQVFKDATPAVMTFAETSAKGLGMSNLEARNAAANFGIFGKSAGLTGNALASFSTDTVKLAADLASFHNTTPEQAIEALGSAFRGEAEPMRAYGVMLDDATMRQEAMKMGLIDSTKQALTPQQKVLAAHALILKQTSDAQGDFSRTSGGLANQQRILAAQMENSAAKLGEAFLPIALAVVTFLNNQLIPGFTGFLDTVGAVFTSVSGVVQGWATSLAPLFAPVLAAFQQVGDGMRILFDFIFTGGSYTMGSIPWLDPIIVGVSSILQWFDVLRSAAEVVISFITTGGADITGQPAWVMSVLDGITVLMVWWDQIRMAAEAVIGFLFTGEGYVMGSIPWLDPFIVGLGVVTGTIEQVQIAFGDFMNGITGQLNTNPDQSPFMLGMYNAGVAIKGVLDQLKLGVDAFIQGVTGQFVYDPNASPFAQGMGLLGQLGRTAFDGLLQIVGQVMGVFQTLATTFMTYIWPNLSLVFNSIMTIGVAAFGMLVQTVQQVAGSVMAALVPTIQWIIGTFIPGVVGIAGAFTGLLNVVIPIIGQIVGFIMGKFVELTPTIIGIMANIQSVIGSAFSIAASLVQVALGVITSVVTVGMNVVQAVIRTVTSVIQGIWSAWGSTIISLIGNAINTVVGVVQGFSNVIAGVFKTIASLLRGDWQGAWDGIKQTVQGAVQVVGSIISGMANAARIVFEGVKTNLVNLMKDAWDGVTGAVKGGIDKTVGFMRELPGKITGALGNLGNLLTSSGKSMLDGMADGIRQGIDGAVRAATGALDAVRKVFPFSPAKDPRSPFYGKGWVLYSGMSISEALGEGMLDNLAQLESAAARVADAAYVEVPTPRAVSMRVGTVDASGIAPGQSVVNQFGDVRIDASTLDGLRSVEEFADMLQRKVRQGGDE